MSGGRREVGDKIIFCNKQNPNGPLSQVHYVRVSTTQEEGWFSYNTDRRGDLHNLILWTGSVTERWEHKKGEHLLNS